MMPGQDAVTHGGVFVGRERELEVLHAGLEDALSGRGRLFLLSGEPGIGKSRLADELGRRARDRGARVLWGRCWEAGGAPAYWPWVQSLRSYMRDQGVEALRGQIQGGASDLAQMLPEIRDMFPGLPEPPPLDPESARFRLFDATTSFLERAARERPLVLVLDDLHAADIPSLLLLEFVASHLARLSILLVGGFRDVDPTLDDPLASTLFQLGREQVTRRLPLGGLSEPEVARYIRLATGVAASEALASAVHQETEGNPLFVEEIVRLLVAEGRLDHLVASRDVKLAIPQGAHAVIGRRVARLSEGCRRTLGHASVLGREFGLDALERVSDVPGEALLRLLDEAAAARLVMEVPGALVRLRFSHALIRDVLYEEIPKSERVSLHRRVGEALEDLYAQDPEPHLAELAHHFLEATAGGDAGPAVDYAWRAADRAAGLLAYEESVRLYEMALQALDLKKAPSPEARCELLIALGEAQTRAGDLPGAKESLLSAAAIARRRQMPEHLARAALGYGGRFVWLRAGADRVVVPLLEEALAALGEGVSELRVRLMSRLAGALRDEAIRDRRDSLSRQAVEMARGIGDRGLLAYALVARFTAIWGPENTRELLDMGTEIVQLAEDAGEPERMIEGHHLRFVALLILGDRTAADAQLEASARISEAVRQVPQDWYLLAHRTTLALLEGRFDETEALMAKASGIVARSQSMDAEVAFRLQTFALRREQGRLEEVEAIIRRSVDDYPWYPMFRCALAQVYAELGREREARSAFEGLAADEFAALPRDVQWLFGMSLLPDVAAFLGDARRAATLYDLLLPFGGLIALSPPELCLGSVSRGLGVAAAAAGRFGRAARHFEEALETNGRIRARPWVARTQSDYARALLARDGAGDRKRAVQLLTTALDTARELGMTALEAEVSARLAELGEGQEMERPAARAAERAALPSVFRRDGEYWSIAFEGDAFRLKDAKGLRYLAALLARPGTEVHVLDLVTGAEGTAPSARGPRDAGLAASGPADAGEVLDAAARAAYRGRLEELQAQIEEAEAWRDPERAARAREEMDFLARELAGATALGGRGRRVGSPAERARQSVTKAIKAAVRRISAHSPALGRHLAATVRTGTFCAYMPDPRVPVVWTL